MSKVINFEDFTKMGDLSHFESLLTETLAENRRFNMQPMGFVMLECYYNQDMGFDMTMDIDGLDRLHTNHFIAGLNLALSKAVRRLEQLDNEEMSNG